MNNAAQPPLPASTPSSSSLYDPAVGGALRSLMDRYGVTLLGEPGRLRGLLQDDCPQAKREISVLLQALDEHVPQDLLRVHSGEPIQSLSPRLAKRLTDEKALSPAAARWAVEAWAQGLSIESVLSSHPQFIELDDAPAARPVPSRPASNEEWGDAVVAQPTPLPHPTPGPLPWHRRFGAALWLGLAMVIGAGVWFGVLQPRAQITAIATDGPWVGNGRAVPVSVAVETRNTTVRRVDVRFVRGDMAWNPQTWSVDVPAGTPANTNLPAGTLSYRTDKPMSATFEYTLVNADGKRSDPVEHTFNILPPVVITGVRVPRPLQVGQDFAATILFRKGAADIVQVERRFVGAGTDTASAEAVSQPLQLKADSNSFEYRFDAAKQPMRSTVEFVLVDAQGVRSDPYRVALDIGTVARAGNGPATVLAIREVKSEGKATGFGAVIGAISGAILGHQVGKGTGRDVATVAGGVGGAVAGHQVEKGVRSDITWETTVRFDDGSTRTVHAAQQPTWRVGDRVQVANGEIRR